MALLVAIVWAIPVVAFTVATWPSETESGIKSRWADEKVDVMRKHHGPGASLVDFRSQVFGNKSDEEIIHPKGFDITTAVPVGEKDPEAEAQAIEEREIDERNELRIAQLANQSRTKTIVFGFLAWALPLAALYLIGIGGHWVSEGFRRKSA